MISICNDLSMTQSIIIALILVIVIFLVSFFVGKDDYSWDYSKLKPKGKQMNDKLLLFKVTLDSVDYDTYDSALIGCRSESELRKSIEDGLLSYDSSWYDLNTGLIQFIQKFYIKKDQSVSSIQLVGVADSEFEYDVNKRIIIILSSYNAG